MNGKLYTITIDSYQLYSGLTKPILKDTRWISWTPNGWINTIQDFLYTNNSQICLETPWMPNPWRINDWCIMEDITQTVLPIQVEMINNVQIYLHVNMLSELTHANGVHILEHLLKSSATPSPSTLQWPHQPCPPLKAWQTWKRVLKQTYVKPNMDIIKQPLSQWIPDQTHKHWQWEWLICPTTMVLYHKT